MSEGFEYRVMTEEDIAEVKQLLYASFANDETLNKSLIIDPSECAVFVESITVQSAQSNVSIVAVCKQSGDIIGCILNTVDTPSHQAKVPISPGNPEHEKMRIILAFLARLHVGIDVCQLYGVDKYVHLQLINVRKDFTKRGVGSQMTYALIKVIKSAGIRLVVGETTGLYSHQIGEKIISDVLNEVKYVDYRDEHGDVIFKDTGIHASGKLLAKLLE